MKSSRNIDSNLSPNIVDKEPANNSSVGPKMMPAAAEPNASQQEPTKVAPIAEAGQSAGTSDTQQVDERPVIRVAPGEITRIVNSAERYLASTGRHFEYGGVIATVRKHAGTGATDVQVLDHAALLYALDGAVWTKLDKRTGEDVRVDPPSRPCKALMGKVDYPCLPVLHGVARQPYLRGDGSLQSEPGYDMVSGMFGAFEASKFRVPSEPTKDDAMAALAVLTELLDEFAFSGNSDRSAALSAMLTAAVRPSLDHAPMYHVRAPQIGSGKSYLCELIAAFATAQRSSPMGFPSGDAECSKLLSAELMRAPAVIEFDNLTTDLVAHKSLCTALTSEHMTARILGLSKTVTVNTRTLFLSSGNNVSAAKDMTRRVLTINLDPACEMPAARAFSRPDLLAEVVANRGRYVSAALTIVRAWIVAGRPVAACKAVGSYGAWSDHCRQPLLWLGEPDPTKAIFDGIAEDPEREVLGRLLSAWHGQFESDATMVRAVVKRMNETTAGVEELRDAVSDTGQRFPINRRSFGWWLKHHAGQIVGGFKLVKSTAKLNAEAWHVVSVSSVVPVSTAVEGEDGSELMTETVEPC